MTRAQRQLVDPFRDVLTQAADVGQLRDDVVPDQPTRFCLHALSAAGSLPSEDAFHRLVDVAPVGLRVPPAPD
ncbi:putative transcriptional regulator (fragment) [Modestobacter italicus]|uniref:Transcriptional regulator n=1 Tax=Modestobacter italicus (strain DSM 44449 / CECT 9708 / BC 501) TaxID=2732864 RepID=I4EUL5_MODI5